MAVFIIFKISADAASAMIWIYVNQRRCNISAKIVPKIAGTGTKPDNLSANFLFDIFAEYFPKSGVSDFWKEKLSDKVILCVSVLQ